MRDPRWQKVDLSIKIDDELVNSPTVNLILDAVARCRDEALDALIEADPTNAGKVSALQARVKYGKFITESLDFIRKDGLATYLDLHEEGKVNFNEDSQNG